MEEMTIFESDVFTDADEARKEFYDELEECFEKPLDSISDHEIYDFLIWRVLGVDWSLNKDKEAPAASLADRASVAKDVCVGMEQNVPERNIDMDAR